MEHNNIYRSVFKVTHSGGSGSCFYLKNYDLFVTNYHVVEGYRTVAVHDNDRNPYLAKVVLVNPALDIALLAAEGDFSALPEMTLAADDSLTIGRKVYVAGYPYGMPFTITEGSVSSPKQLMDGQTVKLRLLEPLQAGNVIVPKNSLVSGSAKVQGERLDILVSSLEYAGNIIPVELAVYDSDGQKGLSVPSSLEQEAAKEAMANIGAGLGTSISFAQSAGQQVAMDITRGLMQGGSQYLAKKFRTVKVHLKANYQVMLYAKQQ